MLLFDETAHPYLQFMAIVSVLSAYSFMLLKCFFCLMTCGYIEDAMKFLLLSENCLQMFSVSAI